MKECLKFYINGEWVDPVKPKTLDVINPATEEPCAKISMGSKADVDKAVAAAKKAFETYSQMSVEDRIALLSKILDVYKSRYGDIAEAITMEMGAPAKLTTRPGHRRHSSSRWLSSRLRRSSPWAPSR